MFESNGKLSYSSDRRLVLKLNQDLSDYYRTLVPAYHRVYKQGWAAHLTVVRPEFDIVGETDIWGKHEGENIKFIYHPYIECGRGFYWFNAWSKRLEEVRAELGLMNVTKYPNTPEGYKKTFHCTIGRYDDLNFGEAPEK
jgi:hypothetical protein